MHSSLIPMLKEEQSKLSENALRVLSARYLRRDFHGVVSETPQEMFERVARAVSEAELAFGPASTARFWEERFREMLTSLDFLPNSPTLMNAGTQLGQLSACFVLPIEDTLESIFQALGNMALIQRSGGGTGFSFSRLRAMGEMLRSSGGASSGPVSFMKIFDIATESIKLGGRRRGANMAVLRVDHPDILAFIDSKLESHSGLTNFNLSVAATDEFMAAVESGGELPLRASNGRVIRNIAARAIFDRICQAAWKTGDPGLVFIDTINRANPTPADGTIESTNPCGEVPLLPYESCNLGSINITHFVNPAPHDGKLEWDRLRRTVHDAVRFLDDVATVNRYPLPETEDATTTQRKIGLGIMGFAEACILCGISYASEDAPAFAEELMKFIAEEARHASASLAAERGPFPAWSRSNFAASGLRLRNATRTSIAPTGTISLIAGTSPGIEPLFALAYRRVGVLEGQRLVELNPVFARYLESTEKAEEIMKHVARTGSLAGHRQVPPELRRLFVTALEVPPEQHVRVQAAFQKHVDNAVSKTVNLPENASLEEVASVYSLAHKLGCKGVTVFRYGSKPGQVLQLGAEEEPYEREYFTNCDPGACKL
ncbi:MAG: adenosylcobalamin-dependent ribonucleoside-diphosphate reductase [Acidobacteriia bacterium]|nr:adenosylcobalamin-dependent ribonucleoside-diphosphate reductase [Terriglobia bacterium]